MNKDSMATGWFYAKGGAPSGGPPGRQVGPLTWEELHLRGQTGELESDDLVWNPGLPDWVRAGQVPGLLATVVAPGAPPPPAATTAAMPLPTGYPPIPAAQAAAAPSDGRRRSWLLPVLIPLIALVVAGAGLGAYFGLRDGGAGSDDGATVESITDVSASTDVSTTAPSTTTATTALSGPPLIEAVAEAPTEIDVLYYLDLLTVTPETGGTLALDGLVLSVPPGAVDAETTIEVKTLARTFQMEQTAPPPADAQAVRVGLVYDFGPDGLVFDKPVTITIPYDETALPEGVSEENVRFTYWNGQTWVSHPGLLDTQKNSVSVQFESFNGIALTTIALGAAAIVETIVVVKFIYDRLKDPERINTDAIINGSAPMWITPTDPTVDEYAKIAVVKLPNGQSVPLSDQDAFGQMLTTTEKERPFIVFPEKGDYGGDLDIRGRYSRDKEKTNWKKPVEYMTTNNFRGDCTDVSNALVSVLVNQGYKAKVVFGYAGDKNTPHVWVETVVDGKPYLVDEGGQFSPLNDVELGKAGLIRADPSDPRCVMYDDQGQEPYDPDWWVANQFAGTYKGTLTYNWPDGSTWDIPLEFTVDDNGKVKGTWAESRTGSDDAGDWAVTMVATFEGEVSENGQLTGSGPFDWSLWAEKVNQGETNSGSNTVEYSGQISGTSFAGQGTDQGFTMPISAAEYGVSGNAR